MAILDEFGAPVVYSSRFAHGSDRSRSRGAQFSINDTDIDKLIPSNDRRTLVSLSKRLAANMGVPKAIVAQKAQYSVGQAWIPAYAGDDTANGDAVERWLKNVWMPNCDVRGGINDWHQYLNDASKDIDFGDHFTLLTMTEDETFPLVQNIPSHRIQSGPDNEKVGEGRYAGATIRDGIIYNKQMRPIAYRVMDEGSSKDFQDISASSVVHVYDKDFSDQGRGFPTFTHAVEDLKHCLQSTEYERIRQLIISSIGLIEYNEHGGPDLDDPGIALGSAAAGSGGVTFQSYQGGMTRYMRANSGEKLEVIKHDNPGDVWESFQDRLNRASVVGSGWSYGMVWKSAGQGTAERADILRARRAVGERQRLILFLAKRVVSYAAAFAQSKGKITRANGSQVFLANPTLWGFSKPPRLSVDDGREDKALLEGWRAGTRNLTEVIEANGRDIEEFTRERANEIVLRKLIAAEVGAAAGVEIEEREMAMLTPNEMGEQGNTPDMEGDESEDETNMASFETLKAKFDAYGVAVRAGAITPAMEDEVEFRSEAGLPAMPAAVKGAWKEDKGFRRPITLVSGSAPPPQGAGNNPIEQ